jgi:hypothetical protein
MSLVRMGTSVGGRAVHPFSSFSLNCPTRPSSLRIPHTFTEFIQFAQLGDETRRCARKPENTVIVLKRVHVKRPQS